MLYCIEFVAFTAGLYNSYYGMVAEEKLYVTAVSLLESLMFILFSFFLSISVELETLTLPLFPDAYTQSSSIYFILFS